MTVKELIEELKSMPQDVKAIIHGYEGGANEISEVELTHIQLNVNHKYFYGDHKFCKESEKDENAVLID